MFGNHLQMGTWAGIAQVPRRSCVEGLRSAGHMQKQGFHTQVGSYKPSFT